MDTIEIIHRINTYFRGYMEIKELHLSNVGKGESRLPKRKKNLITRDIPTLFYNLFDKKDYQITGSIGKGRISDTPWVAVMYRPITTSTKKGVYLVFLFSTNFDKIYLCFGFGADEFGTTQLGLKQIRDKRDWIRNLMNVSNKYAIPNDLLDIKNIGYRNCQAYAFEWPLDNPEKGVSIIESYSKIYQEYIAKYSKYKFDPHTIRPVTAQPTNSSLKSNSVGNAAYSQDIPNSLRVAESSTARAYGDKTYEDGIKAGRSSERKAIIKQMRQKGLSDTLIASYTGLPLSYISKI